MRNRQPLLVVASLALALGACGGAVRPNADKAIPSTKADSFSTDARAPGPTLLVTNPTVDTARAFVGLVEAGLLAAPGLRIIGVHHAQDGLDTGATEAFLEQRGARWFTVTAVDCQLEDDPFIFTQSCADAFGALLARSDGLILTGGPDLPAADYGEAQSLLTDPRSFDRTRFELALVAALIGGKGWGETRSALLDSRPGYLVFAICLGMQELNVATGGSLFQDIPTEVYGLATFEEVLAEPRAAHRQYRLARQSGYLGRFTRHRLLGTSAWSDRGLPDLETDSPRVLSAHHQAISRLGQGLELLATSRDRAIVEAVGHSRFPGVLGVQFHPEHEAIATAASGQKVSFVDAVSLNLHQALWAWVGRGLSLSYRGRQEHGSAATHTPTPAE